MIRLPLLRRALTATVLTASVLATAVIGGGSAQAAMPIEIRVAEGYYPQSETTAPLTYRSPACKAGVDEQPATGMSGLKAARAAGCVRSFELSGDEEFGHYLECIDERCGTTGFYWAIYQNGKLTCTGLDGIVLAPGDELAFSYENYATALDLAGC